MFKKLADQDNINELKSWKQRIIRCIPKPSTLAQLYLSYSKRVKILLPLKS